MATGGSSNNQEEIMLEKDLVVGGRYNWINQPERLVYIGVKKGWHQFGKVENPYAVWSELLPEDLSLMEPSTPVVPQSFTVKRRNYGHWDICKGGNRVYRIRGGPSAYRVIQEDVSPSVVTHHSTVMGCMLYICDKLMFELLYAEGQSPHVIEGWNV